MFKTSNTDNTNTEVDDVWTFFIYDAFGKKVAEYGGLSAMDEGGVKYVLSDWQGSTRAITNNTGVVQARMDYTAFGEEILVNVGQRTVAQGFNSNQTLRNKYALTERDQPMTKTHLIQPFGLCSAEAREAVSVPLGELLSALFID
jgi:hypothetical protein